jgi:hypothetical protein
MPARRRNSALMLSVVRRHGSQTLSQILNAVGVLGGQIVGCAPWGHTRILIAGNQLTTMRSLGCAGNPVNPVLGFGFEIDGQELFDGLDVRRQVGGKLVCGITPPF